MELYRARFRSLEFLTLILIEILGQGCLFIGVIWFVNYVEEL